MSALPVHAVEAVPRAAAQVREYDGRRAVASVVALTCAGLTYSMLQNMVLPALPAMRRDLGADTRWITWVFTVFLLTSCVLTGLVGKLGDQHGKVRMLVFSVGALGVGCVAAALAGNVVSLIAARAVQGAGGAILPLAFAILGEQLPRERMAAGIGIVSTTFGIGTGAGIVLAGVITQHASWRWLFVVGAAMAAVAAVLVRACVPESTVRTRARLDLVGAAMLSAALVSLLLALTQGPSWGWRSPWTLALLIAAVLLSAIWIRVESRVPEPLIRIDVLRRRPVFYTNVTALTGGFAGFAVFALLPLLAQTPRGLPADVARHVPYGLDATPLGVGMILLPSSALMLVVAPLAGSLADRYGFKRAMITGLSVATVGIGYIAMHHATASDLVVGTCLMNLGLTVWLTTSPAIVLQAVEPGETGVATGMMTVVRTVGGVLGVQAGASILSADRVHGFAVPAESAYAGAFWMAVGAAVAALAASTLLPGRHRRYDAV